MKKQIIAAGLTAALVLGTAPAAFAADGGVDQGTIISVKTSVANIDVTVPLALEVTGPVTGGGLTTVPDSTAYKIVNNSTKFGVNVKSVQGEAQNGWTLSGVPLDSQSAIKGTVGDICLQLKSAEQSAKGDVKTLSADPATVNWAIPAHSASGASVVTGELGIDIVKDKAFGEASYKGSSIAVQKSLGATASPAVKVVYTVEIDESGAGA